MALNGFKLKNGDINHRPFGLFKDWGLFTAALGMQLLAANGMP